MFRGCAVATDARAAVERLALELLTEVASCPGERKSVRVAQASGGLACLVLVWPADARMPTALGEGPRARKSGAREECRSDVLAAVREAGRPLTRKEVVRALKAARLGHGAGTVAKALAELTAAGELVNRRDKRGYPRCSPRGVGEIPRQAPAQCPTSSSAPSSAARSTSRATSTVRPATRSGRNSTASR